MLNVVGGSVEVKVLPAPIRLSVASYEFTALQLSVLSLELKTENRVAVNS
jgi:hypothetical protein